MFKKLGMIGLALAITLLLASSAMAGGEIRFSNFLVEG